jgi:CHAD domain-containing protein
LTLREHVRSHTATLLRRLAFQVRQAAVRGDEESVHDLRVAIRRLRECLRTFKDVYPGPARSKIRKDLRQLMKRAEHVRSADIALDLLKKAGLDETTPLLQATLEQRVRYRSELHEELKSLASRPYTRTWREALEI